MIIDILFFVVVNIHSKKQSGSQKLSKKEEQVIADIDHEIELLRDIFASNLTSQKMVLVVGTKLKRSISYPPPLSTRREIKSKLLQAVMAENRDLYKEISRLKGLAIQTNNERMALNDIGKCF